MATQTFTTAGMRNDPPKRMHGRHFLNALVDAGIIAPPERGEFISGVTITASVGGAVTIDVHRFADDRLYRIEELVKSAIERDKAEDEAA